jgi:exodeoxyribonuclease-3
MKQPKTLVAWNVNSVRTTLDNRYLHELLEEKDPDIFCMGETKLNHDTKSQHILLELDYEFPQYQYKYYNTSSGRKGYSGTAIWCKVEPMQVKYDIPDHDGLGNEEGRVIAVEFKNFWLVHVYTPNSGEGLKRINYRTEVWDPAFSKYIKDLQKEKPVLVAGDLNIANDDIDIFKPEGHSKSAGFTPQERDNFKKLLHTCDLVDSFRYMRPEEKKFSYWTYLFNARNYNKGWRIDYWLVPTMWKKKIKEADILDKQMGSDHAPVFLRI